MERMILKVGVCMVCITLLMTGTTTASIEDDEKECADQMAQLASCIPFVSGTAKEPTKECCDDTNKVRSAKPKCLCVLIKESNDPSIGLPINTTLALQMPTACKIDAKVSDCPRLLNLAADSPDAKMFKADGSDSSTSTSEADHTTTTSPSSSSSSSSSDSTKTSSVTPNGSTSTAPAATILLLLMASMFSIFI